MKIATKEVLRSVSFEETYDHVGVNNSTKIVGFSSNGKFVKFAPIVSERGTTEPGNWGVPYETKGEKFSETITRFQDETGLTPDTLHVVETWRGMDFGDEVSVEYKILPSFKFKPRTWFESSDISDDFDEATNPLVEGLPDGEYCIRTNIENDRLLYYHFAEKWYFAGRHSARSETVAAFGL